MEEVDAAREALMKVLEEYPGDLLLEARLADLDRAAHSADGPSQGEAAGAAAPVDDDGLDFELELMDDDDSNVLPFKRASNG